MMPGSGIFDENQVHFKLEIPESCYQSDAIFASAVFKLTGEPIPLQCQWFNLPPKTVENENPQLIAIPGVTGAMYQPSIEDVGMKICVHALPVSEHNSNLRQYQGMPLFAEVGPLYLDSYLQAEKQQIID